MTPSSHLQRYGPCACGSGRSCATCCLPWEEALRRLLARLLAFAGTSFVERQEAEARAIFAEREGRRPAGAGAAEGAGLRFLEWFLHDYVPSGEGGPLLGRFADGASGLDAHEEELLLASLLAPFRAYEVSEPPVPRGIVLRDLLTGGEGRAGLIGFEETPIRSDIVICRLLPAGRRLRTGMSVLRLPATGREELLAYLRSAYQMARPARHVALEDFLDASPHLYHHFFRLRGRELGGRAWETLRRSVYAPGALTYPGGERMRILASLDRQPELERQEAAGEAARYTWVDLATGCARAAVAVSAERVVIHAETREDLAAGAAYLEGCLRGLIRLPAQRVEEPLPPAPDAAPAERGRPAGRAFLTRILAGWPDRPSPLLQGRTPREARQSQAGRAQVQQLLLALERGLARQKRLGRAWVEMAPLREALQVPSDRALPDLPGAGQGRRRRRSTI